MKAITVDTLTKRYKEHLAVDEISFSVDEGELFAFLGENGAGKSTTINILCTILEKTAGNVHVLGDELGKADDRIRDNIGIVFQNSVLDGKLTVKENLYTRAAYYGLSKQETARRLEPFLERFELDRILKQRYETLSGGQRRRVDIIRALLHRPRILFLDEPTTGLDPKSRKIVWDYIHYLRREHNMTIFLTTHYMEETNDADHVVIMDRGRIIADGVPAELKRRFAATRLLWYARQTEENERLLAETEHHYDAGRYTIFPQNDLTVFLYDHRDSITDYEVVKGSMDDVFLHLTGKEFLA